jgi:PEP-CTERM motif
VPEPATWVMMAIGFLGVGLAGYRGARGAAMAKA